MRRALAFSLVWTVTAFAVLLLAVLILDPPERLSSQLQVIASVVWLSATVILLVQGELFRSSYRSWQGRRALLVEAPDAVRRARSVVAVAVALGVATGSGVTALWWEPEPPKDEPADATVPEKVSYEEGDTLPDLRSTLADGSEWRLSDHAGEKVLIHFWASWNDTSVGQLLRLKAHVDELGDESPQVSGVCVDYATKFPSELIGRLGIPWPHVFESGAFRKNSIITALRPKSWADSVWLVDERGVLMAKDLRGLGFDGTLRDIILRAAVAEGPAPDFEATTLDGERWRLSDHRGQVVLLDFWATWCGPCRKETPYLKRVHDRFSARADFEILGISSDQDGSELESYLDEQDMTWPQILDPDPMAEGSISKKYAVSGIPFIWIIGRDGRVAAYGVRGEAIGEAVAAALAQ